MRELELKAVTAAACLLATACNQSTQQTADQLENRVDQAAESAGAKIDNATGAAEAHLDNAIDRMGAAITPTPNPQEFVDKAAKSDAFEIATAQLAAKNASSPAVKAFAQDMIKAHTDSTTKIKMAAGKLAPNAILTRDQNDDLAELGKLTGATFDKEYMDGQVDAHEDALALMRAFAADGAYQPQDHSGRNRRGC
jgi:putative membrane protein